jgi:hypothetical protein
MVFIRTFVLKRNENKNLAPLRDKEQQNRA